MEYNSLKKSSSQNCPRNKSCYVMKRKLLVRFWPIILLFVLADIRLYK